MSIRDTRCLRTRHSEYIPFDYVGSQRLNAYNGGSFQINGVACRRRTNPSKEIVRLHQALQDAGSQSLCVVI